MWSCWANLTESLEQWPVHSTPCRRGSAAVGIQGSNRRIRTCRCSPGKWLRIHSVMITYLDIFVISHTHHCAQIGRLTVVRCGTRRRTAWCRCRGHRVRRGKWQIQRDIMLMAANDAQKVQLIVHQIRVGDNFRGHQLIIGLDESEHKATIHYTQQIEYKKGQTNVQRLCQFIVHAMRLYDFGGDHTYQCL